MPKRAGSKPHKHNDERLFFSVAIIVALVFGTGFCLLIFALNRRDAVPDETKTTAISPDHPRQLINFTLTDRTGRTVTRAELEGDFLIVNFLQTSCSLTCREVSRHLAEIQQLTTNQTDVKLVSLTVDPRTDTVPVLAEYGARYGADTNRWLLLTGAKPELYGLIGTSFLAHDTDDPFTYMPGNFTHTERIALVDGSGQVRAYFDGLREDVAPVVVAEIARLRK
jgi:cytochrome oxidase Cu insertion factor (SCO1/SenC/PrrC family)